MSPVNYQLKTESFKARIKSSLFLLVLTLFHMVFTLTSLLFSRYYYYFTKPDVHHTFIKKIDTVDWTIECVLLFGILTLARLYKTLSKNMYHDLSVYMKNVRTIISINSVLTRSKYKKKARKRLTSLPRSLRDGVSNVRPGKANKFKKAHNNTLSEQMVDNMSGKMKSVGAIISSNFVIGTVFKVGSKYVMTALHVVQRITIMDCYSPIFHIKPAVNYMKKQAVLELKSFEGLPRSLADGVSNIRPGNVNKFKKVHDNTQSEQMVNNMSVKMKSVGAIISSNFVIGTVFRVGSKYVMTTLHVVKRITSLPRSHTDGVSAIRPGNANQFKKAHDNTLSEQMVDNMSGKMKSVGAILSSNLAIGTVFRVGSKYVMTALHVVKRITNPRELPSIADTDWSKLGDPTVCIKFAALVNDDESPKFYIKPDVIYMNKQLDIAVLELKSLEGLPRSLKLSKYMGHVKCVNIIGFGHPTDPRKQLDANCEVLNINHIITDIDNYSNANPNVLQLNGLKPGGIKGEYIELGNTFMFPCHTFFEQGSSGAPAIEENEVVGILVKGIPASYYELRDSPYFTASGQPYFTASGIDKLPKNLMFELCIKTESIFNDMCSIVPMLVADLFD